MMICATKVHLDKQHTRRNRRRDYPRASYKLRAFITNLLTKQKGNEKTNQRGKDC